VSAWRDAARGTQVEVWLGRAFAHRVKRAMRDAVRRAISEWDTRVRYLRRLRHCEASCRTSLRKMCTIVAFGVWAKHAKEVRFARRPVNPADC